MEPLSLQRLGAAAFPRRLLVARHQGSHRNPASARRHHRRNCSRGDCLGTAVLQELPASMLLWGERTGDYSAARRVLGSRAVDNYIHKRKAGSEG